MFLIEIDTFYLKKKDKLRKH